MKIALCLYGQIRDLKQGYTEYLNHILSRYNVDIFAHLWETETSEVNEFIKLYNPKSFKIEPQVAFDMNRYSNAYGVAKHHPNSFKAAFNSLSQFYSLYQVCHLRREYEQQNNIQYDLCIKGRLDIWFKFLNINLDELDLTGYNVPCDPAGFIYNDVIAFATPDIIDLVANKYIKINEWYDQGDYNFIPESVTNKVLTNNNITIIKNNDIGCDLYRCK